MNSLFTDQLSGCECCPRRCGVNRLSGKKGFCRIGSDIVISHAGLHFGEEPPISGKNGSGTIFFSGCNLRCVFCQNYQISQEFQKCFYERNRVLTTDELASEMLCLQQQGAHNINFVSPSHMIFHMADTIKIARAGGLNIPVVYNSNGYDSVEVLRQIRGLVDIYLPDIKYLENDLGKLYSAADDYADIVPGVLLEMFSQAGELKTDRKGIAVSGLLVRHLVLPGHTENSRRCLRLLADISPDIHVSIMSQYSPQYKADSFATINRTLTKGEYDEITDYALDLGLENAFIQKLESRNLYLPDFDHEDPFESD
jgi:putative pyruvate formate lyase activating enzyme